MATLLHGPPLTNTLKLVARLVFRREVIIDALSNLAMGEAKGPGWDWGILVGPEGKPEGDKALVRRNLSVKSGR